MGRLSELDLLLKEPQTKHTLAEIDPHCQHKSFSRRSSAFSFQRFHYGILTPQEGKPLLSHSAVYLEFVTKSNCVRPPHPKGMGYASGRTPRLTGFQEHPNLRFPGYAYQNNCIFAFGCVIALLINLKKKRNPGEGSLHPQPKGWGIRDPPHSRCIKNSYRVLLTRGLKGCYVYFMDKDTERFVKSRMEN